MSRILASLIAIALAVALTLTYSPNSRVRAASEWQTVTGASFAVQVPSDWTVTDPSGDGTAIIAESVPLHASIRASVARETQAVWASMQPSSSARVGW